MAIPSLLEGVTPPAGIDPAALESACGRVRAQCHWHIAPHYTQTFTMPVPADGLVDLDTLLLVSVESVTVDGDPLTYGDGYDWTDQGRIVLLSRRQGRGLRSLVIIATHGYETCPPDLVQLVAQLAAPGMAGRMVRSEGTGEFTASYFGLQEDPVIAAYRIPVVA